MLSPQAALMSVGICWLYAYTMASYVYSYKGKILQLKQRNVIWLIFWLLVNLTSFVYLRSLLLFR